MISDEAFNEAFKPLHIPSAYNTGHSWRDKVTFALANLGSGTVEDVAAELLRLDGSLDANEAKRQCETILSTLFDSGLIKGTELNDGMVYNLSKILVPNSGSIHPED